MQNWQQICSHSKLISSLTSWKSDITPSCRSLYSAAFKMLWKGSLSPQFRKDPEISWDEKFSIPQPGSWNVEIQALVMSFCVVPSLQSLQAMIWGAGRILQLAEIVLPEHVSKQGTCCQLQHLLTRSRARCNDAISTPSLTKILASISVIKLKSWVSFSRFSGDS